MENTIRIGAKSPRKVRLQVLAVLASLVVLVILAAWMIVSEFASGSGQSAVDMQRTAFEEATGIRILRVALTAGGGMLDLRYQILDPDKAVVVHDEEKPPILVDEATGQAISRPWMDHSHDRDLHHAVSYYELIMNAGGILKRGSKVTIIVGDSRLEHIVVQ